MVIALAKGEAIPLPDEVAISVVTLCGLHHAVLVADDDTRPGRLATLVEVERTMTAIPLDARVAPHYGTLVAEARRRHGARPKVADALVAATAQSHGLALYTRDRDHEHLDLENLILV